MTDEKIRHYEKLLGDLRDRLDQERRQLLDQVRKPVGNATGNDIATASLRPETVGVNEGDEEVALGVYSGVESTHAEVVAALQRIADGSFGQCERCGKKIAQGRLDAVPYARQCTACSRD